MENDTNTKPECCAAASAKQKYAATTSSIARIGFVGQIGKKVRDELPHIVRRAAIINAYCIRLLTFNPVDRFCRINYFSELLANSPTFIRERNRGEFVATSPYIHTGYLSDTEAQKYRLFVGQDGKIYTNSNGTPCLFSTTSDQSIRTMFVLTANGELFSAEKNGNKQHSSFNRGGYLLFAGYWEVENGKVKNVIAESGHYEPPITSLQNVVRIFNFARVNLGETELLYVYRTHVGRGLSSEVKRFLLRDLIGVGAIDLPDNPANLSIAKTALVPKHFFESELRLPLAINFAQALAFSSAPSCLLSSTSTSTSPYPS